MITNICFHGVGTCDREREPGESRYWVPEDTFLRILDEIAEHPTARISFDDGNTSDIERGLPALAERGLVATFFPIASRLDDARSLSGQDLRVLRAAGMRIGSHGWAHVPWRGLNAQEAERELVRARAALAEASDGPIDVAALPLGRYDRRTITQLRAAGYRTVYTSDRFRARERSWLQARYSVTATDDRASVRRMLTHRAGLEDLRNITASSLKRWR